VLQTIDNLVVLEHCSLTGIDRRYAVSIKWTIMDFSDL